MKIIIEKYREEKGNSSHSRTARGEIVVSEGEKILPVRPIP